MIISRTPFRVSFLGGGTDYPAWYREHGGAVLATTIDKYCYISVRELPPFFDHKWRIVYSLVENVKDRREIAHPAVRGVLEWLGVEKGLEIHHDGDLPARSGMGSSSAFTVGLLNALRALEGRHITKEALANDAIHVEQEVLRESVGAQDQISVAFGGFNHISFRPDGAYQVAPMILPRERLDSLQEQLMLVFTGISRTAAEVADTVIGNMRAQAAALRAMQEMVAEGVEILSSPSADLTEFGRLLSRSWRLKRELSPSVSNAIVDDLFETATRAGAVGGKLLGAGGGGFVLLFVRKEDRARLLEALPRFTVVPFRFESSGCQIALYQPNGL
jgi:D-glycero-alpha-D-manno-heptose-7-phosphate kinase